MHQLSGGGGDFPMLVVALALRMWNRGKSIREVGLFCLKSAAGYALGLIFFKLVIMIPADTSYVATLCLRRGS